MQPLERCDREDEKQIELLRPLLEYEFYDK